MIFITILPYLVGMRCVMHGAVELACEHVPGETGRSWREMGAVFMLTGCGCMHNLMVAMFLWVVLSEFCDSPS